MSLYRDRAQIQCLVHYNSSNLRYFGPQVSVLPRVLQEIDELHDLNLGLLAASHVLEGHVDLTGVDDLQAVQLEIGRDARNRSR